MAVAQGLITQRVKRWKILSSVSMRSPDEDHITYEALGRANMARMEPCTPKRAGLTEENRRYRKNLLEGKTSKKFATENN